MIDIIPSEVPQARTFQIPRDMPQIAMFGYSHGGEEQFDDQDTRSRRMPHHSYADREYETMTIPNRSNADFDEWYPSRASPRNGMYSHRTPYGNDVTPEGPVSSHYGPTAAPPQPSPVYGSVPSQSPTSFGGPPASSPTVAYQHGGPQPTSHCHQYREEPPCTYYPDTSSSQHHGAVSPCPSSRSSYYAPHSSSHSQYVAERTSERMGPYDYHHHQRNYSHQTYYPDEPTSLHLQQQQQQYQHYGQERSYYPPPNRNVIHPIPHHGSPSPSPHHHLQRTPPPPSPNYDYHWTQNSTSSGNVDEYSKPVSDGRIHEVGENDVLCGRGAPTNWNPGNQVFRELVKKYQAEYLASRRADKPLIAYKIVEEIKSRGGRFLRRHKVGGVWERGHFEWVDIGEQRAYEKACQALREGAPHLRRMMASSSKDSSSQKENEDDAESASATDEAQQTHAENTGECTIDVKLQEKV